ncbi:hypothetical protein PTKIN_Ptkin14bG0224400 [Pterospermum kingtungense]
MTAVEEGLENLIIDNDDDGLVIDLGAVDVQQARPDLCLVGRFTTDKAINFNVMRNRMASIWQPVKGVLVRDIGAGRFLFQFYHQIDMKRVFEVGPWSFDNHMLVLHKLEIGDDPLHVPLFHLNLWVNSNVQVLKHQRSSSPEAVKLQASTTSLVDVLTISYLFDPIPNKTVKDEFYSCKIKSQDPCYEFRKIAGNSTHSSWLPPDFGAIKVNVDASFYYSRSSAQTRNVACDHQGLVLCSEIKLFSNIRYPSQAELIAILQGLSLASNNDFQHIESDSLIAIKKIAKGLNSTREWGSLIADISIMQSVFDMFLEFTTDLLIFISLDPYLILFVIQTFHNI